MWGAPCGPSDPGEDTMAQGGSMPDIFGEEQGGQCG